MLGWGKVFKTRGHYVFDYKPRYYDERKERLDKLREKYAGQEVLEDEEIEPIKLTKSDLRKAWTRTKTTSSDTKSARRLAIIIAILFGIVAYILDFHRLF